MQLRQIFDVVQGHSKKFAFKIVPPDAVDGQSMLLKAASKVEAACQCQEPELTRGTGLE